jgi:hypothetical protein
MVERNGETHVSGRASATAVVLLSLYLILLPISTARAQYVFEPSICVAGGDEGQTSPSLAVDSRGNPSIAYVNEYSPWSIEFVRSTDGGRTFLEAVRVAWDWAYISPSLAIYEDNPYLAYVDWTLGAHDIYFTHSTDGGESFLPSLLVGKSDGYTKMALDQEGNPFIVCRTYYCFPAPEEVISYLNVYRSTDGGESFVGPVIADNLPYYFRFIHLAIDSLGNPHIAWGVGSWWETSYLYYVRSTDRGESFLPSFRLDDDTGGNSDLDLQIAGWEDPCVVWSGVYGGQGGLYFSRSTDGGESFLPQVLVDTSSSGKDNPSMQIDPQGNPFVAWTDSRCGIYFTYSTDGGTTFLPGGSVDSTGHSQDSPTLGLAPVATTVHLAWKDSRQDDGDIYYTYGSLAGINEEMLPSGMTGSVSMRAFPNPFYGGATIVLTSAQPYSRADISIYNLAGQVVRTQSATADQWGCCRIHWDGRSDEGMDQPCGVYLCHLSTEGEEVAVKLLKLE